MTKDDDDEDEDDWGNKLTRMRLRPNRGFPGRLACDVIPLEIDRLRPPRGTAWSDAKPEGGRATWSRGEGESTLARYMWGDVTERGHAGSPGSGGASPYLRRRTLNAER